MVSNFSHNTEFVTFSRKIFRVIFVCIYLRAFLKKKEKEKEKDPFLTHLEIPSTSCSTWHKVESKCSKYGTSTLQVFNKYCRYLEHL